MRSTTQEEPDVIVHHPPVEAAGPVDGRTASLPRPATSYAAAHRTLEIPLGFPQLPQARRLDFHYHDVKIWIGLGTPGSCS